VLLVASKLERPHHLIAGVPSGSDREGLAAPVAAAMIPESSSMPITTSLGSLA
jgi:hypothetical protein